MTRGGAPLDLSLANKEELIREVKADGNLGCIFQKLVDFKDTKRGVQTNRRVTALDLRALDCSLVRDLLGKTMGPWSARAKRPNNGWLIFKDTLQHKDS